MTTEYEATTAEREPSALFVECPPSQRVDGLFHSLTFDGDDPRTICVFCGEVRDALTGNVVTPARGAGRILDAEQAYGEALAEYLCRDMSGPAVSVEHVGLPSPDAHAVAASVQPVEQIVPLDVQIRRIILSRSAGQISSEQATRAVLSAFIDVLPVPAGALDVEAWGENELGWDRNPTTAGYLQYLLDRIRGVVTESTTPVVGLDARLRMGAVLAAYSHARINSAEAIDQLLAALGAEPAPTWTPWVTLTGRDIEHLLVDHDGVVLQAQDTADQTTAHPLSVGDCDGEGCDAELPDGCDGCGGREEDTPRCVLLLSPAFPDGVLHLPEGERTAVRIEVAA